MKSLRRKALNQFGYDIVKSSAFYKRGRKHADPEELEFIKAISGNFCLPKYALEDAIDNATQRNSICQTEVAEVASHYIKPGTVVLDIGAHYGQLSLLFSNMVGINGIVYAFEGHKMVFDILQKNIAANLRHNIVPLNKAVYHSTGEILLPAEAGKEPDTENGETVETLSIDNLDINLPVSFMKVSLQGIDLLAMLGAVNTIRKHKMPIIFAFEHHLQEGFKSRYHDYAEFAESIGYRFERMDLDANYLIVPKD